MNSELKVVRIFDLRLGCMFPMRNSNAPGTAFSDHCQMLAITGVQRSDGSVSPRCNTHRGQVDRSTTGRVVETMTTRDDVHPSLVLSWPERSSATAEAQ